MGCVCIRVGVVLVGCACIRVGVVWQGVFVLG